MNKKLVVVLLGVAIAMASGSAYAQLGGLGGSLLGGKSSSSSSVSADDIVKKYVDGSKDVMTADVHLLNALGLKVQRHPVLKMPPKSRQKAARHWQKKCPVKRSFWMPTARQPIQKVCSIWRKVS